MHTEEPDELGEGRDEQVGPRRGATAMIGAATIWETKS